MPTSINDSYSTITDGPPLLKPRITKAYQKKNRLMLQFGGFSLIVITSLIMQLAKPIQSYYLIAQNLLIIGYLANLT
ncbi:hypothetical protein LU276_02110 [Moraxella haemolytica]|uniref:hypothetical protein n=1 Tax=Moraxella haemolytica TaxID=2904119 RepID=UPI002543AFCB|nr:hypothetical protein [Moraxella sp. ZY171148]WII95652.1 hypothetical protein LU276_02110 [Moraxella sp. ZY171148]